MVAQLDTASMEVVVQGETSRSGGLISCHVAPRPKSYDHKTAHRLKGSREPVPPKELFADWVYEPMTLTSACILSGAKLRSIGVV